MCVWLAPSHHVCIYSTSPTAQPPLRRHLITGIDYSLELCGALLGAAAAGSSSSSGAVTTTTSTASTTTATAASLGGMMMLRMGLGAVSAASSRQMATAYVAERVRRPLEAAHVATQVMDALQAHYAEVVRPALASSPAEQAAASSALLGLVRTVEVSISEVLRKCVDAFTAEVRAPPPPPSMHACMPLLCMTPGLCVAHDAPSPFFLASPQPLLPAYICILMSCLRARRMCAHSVHQSIP